MVLLSQLGFQSDLGLSMLFDASLRPAYSPVRVNRALVTNHYHHHQERTPLWGMAVRMSPLQTVRSCARCQVEKRPMLADFRSASTVRVHVCAGLPLRLFQSRGWP